MLKQRLQTPRTTRSLQGISNFWQFHLLRPNRCRFAHQLRVAAVLLLVAFGANACAASPASVSTSVSTSVPTPVLVSAPDAALATAPSASLGAADEKPGSDKPSATASSDATPPSDRTLVAPDLPRMGTREWLVEFLKMTKDPITDPIAFFKKMGWVVGDRTDLDDVTYYLKIENKTSRQLYPIMVRFNPKRSRISSIRIFVDDLMMPCMQPKEAVEIMNMKYKYHVTLGHVSEAMRKYKFPYLIHFYSPDGLTVAIFERVEDLCIDSFMFFF